MGGWETGPIWADTDRGRRATPAEAAPASRIARNNSLAMLSRCWRTPNLALANTATAPAAKASSVKEAPASVNEEQITTGVGCVAMICRKNVNPSMRGISMSNRMTSGHCSSILGMALKGSAAEPNNCRSGCPWITSAINCRTRAESSTTKIRVLATMSPPQSRDVMDLRVVATRSVRSACRPATSDESGLRSPDTAAINPVQQAPAECTDCFYSQRSFHIQMLDKTGYYHRPARDKNRPSG